MTVPDPIPAGPDLDADQHKRKPGSLPQLPAAWTATVVLSPVSTRARARLNGNLELSRRINIVRHSRRAENHYAA